MGPFPATNFSETREVVIMKRAVVLIPVLIALAGLAAQAAQVDLGISVADGKLRSFYIAVGDHYRVAPRVVVDLRTRYRLLDEELPLVFFLAARARVSPQAVIDLRLGRLSWLDVALRLRLSPEIFFVSIGAERIGPPYGNAYGYYRKRGRAGDWGGLALTDREAIDLVNLRFMSEYHGLGPDAIIAVRGRQKSFVAVHDEIGRGKDPGAPGKAPKAGPRGKGKKK
jgi:hypothetical protein